MASKRFAALLSLVLGCWGATKSAKAVEKHVGADHPPTSRAFEAAKRVSQDMQKLDYAAPMNGSRRALVHKAAGLLFDACWDGVLDACVEYEGYRPDAWYEGVLHEAAITTAESCVRGNKADCAYLLLHGRFASLMMELPRTEVLYFDACKSGDRVACSKVSAANACLRADEDSTACKQLRATAPSALVLLALVRGYCDRGFNMACAYMSDAHDEPRFQSSADEAERYAKFACERGDPWACDRAETLAFDLGHEDAIPAIQAHRSAGAVAMCKAGNWVFCRRIDDLRAERLTRHACLAGEAIACEFSTSADAKELACSGMGIECDHWLELVGDDPHKVRDVLEHSCQWAHVEDCQRLVLGYRAHTYDEPVAGRADALQQYVCKQDAKLCVAP